MTEDNPHRVEIDELRQRWEVEATPQLTLQLAEEYRHAGEIDQAVSILETGLESHPEHVAARVALGRYRMDLGRLREARSALEPIVAEDPIHLVANKALVRLYAQLGEENKARDRLDLYKILNEGDPEIEELELEISGELPPQPTVSMEQDASMEHDAPVFTSIGGQEPFVGLATRVAEASYWEAVGTEGIFPVRVASSSVAVAVEPAAESEQDLYVERVSPEPDSDVEGATVTLANLYLEQGHLDDAERSFQEVLAREPGNPEALEGLESVLRGRSDPATEDEKNPKITMLKSYLERIRSSAKG